jgi:hypothetical protein
VQPETPIQTGPDASRPAMVTIDWPDVPEIQGDELADDE